ncbi:MAG: glycosyltransferase family 2 protein [Patescibacteria group bacterium]
MAPKVSAIVLNYNLKYLPRLCIESLQRSKTDFPFEIVVPDNGSHDESLDYLRDMHKKGEITLVEIGKNLGFGKGNNEGVKHANGKYVLILNPDVGVEPDTIQKMTDYMETHLDVGLLGPQLYFFNGQIQDSCRRFMRPMDLIIKRTPLRHLPFFRKRIAHYLMADYDKKKTQEVDFVTGACIMLPRHVYQEIGGFDPRYFMFMEDADLCRTLWERGRKVVYFPEARALHYHKRLSGGNLLGLLTKRIFWMHVNSAIKYFWKWRSKKLP